MAAFSNRLSPDSVRYSQDSVAGDFMCGRPISSTFKDLLYKRITVDQIPEIQVVKDDKGIYWALTGNRRLYIYKWLQRLGVVSTIPIDLQSIVNNAGRFLDRMTTVTEGQSIRIRQQNAVSEIEAIIAAWKRSTGRFTVPMYDVEYERSRQRQQQEEERQAADRRWRQEQERLAEERRRRQLEEQYWRQQEQRLAAEERLRQERLAEQERLEAKQRSWCTIL